MRRSGVSLRKLHPAGHIHSPGLGKHLSTEKTSALGSSWSLSFLPETGWISTQRRKGLRMRAAPDPGIYTVSKLQAIILFHKNNRYANETSS